MSDREEWNDLGRRIDEFCLRVGALTPEEADEEA